LLQTIKSEYKQGSQYKLVYMMLA